MKTQRREGVDVVAVAWACDGPTGMHFVSLDRSECVEESHRDGSPVVPLVDGRAVSELIAATKIEREIRAHRTGWTTAERWSYAERLSMPSNSTRNAIEHRASENVAAALAACERAS